MYGHRNGFEDEGASSSSSPANGLVPRIEISPMGVEGTKERAKNMNSRFRDFEMKGGRPNAQPSVQTKEFLQRSIPAVRQELVSQQDRQRLMLLDRTPDGKRKMYALFLHKTFRGMAERCGSVHPYTVDIERSSDAVTHLCACR